MIHNVYANKAGRIGDEIPPTTVIRIANEVPHFDSLEGASHLYEKQAEDLSNALMDSLPQATLFRLISKLLTKFAEKDYFRGTSK
jgi:hypothetical protein